MLSNIDKADIKSLIYNTRNHSVDADEVTDKLTAIIEDESVSLNERFVNVVSCLLEDVNDEDAYEEGWDEGHDAGYDEAADDAEDEAYQDGYDDGFEDGKEPGYKDGYDDGWEDGHNNNHDNKVY